MFFTSPGFAHWCELSLRLRAERARRLREQGDLGASAVEWVVITAALIILVGVVGTIIVQRLKAAAGQLNPTPNVGGGGAGP